MFQIKYIASTAVAAVMVAGLIVTPALATSGSSNSETHVEVRNGHQSVEVRKNEHGKHVVITSGGQKVEVKKSDDCDDDKRGSHVKIENGHQKVEVKKSSHKSDDDCKVKETKKTEVKKTEVAPVKTVVATATSNPALVVPAAAVAAAPVAAQPATLPETGPGALVAASFAGITGLGYAANMFRLRRQG